MKFAIKKILPYFFGGLMFLVAVIVYFDRQFPAPPLFEMLLGIGLVFSLKRQNRNLDIHDKHAILFLVLAVVTFVLAGLYPPLIFLPFIFISMEGYELFFLKRKHRVLLDE